MVVKKYQTLRQAIGRLVVSACDDAFKGTEHPDTTENRYKFRKEKVKKMIDELEESNQKILELAKKAKQANESGEHSISRNYIVSLIMEIEKS